jgi:hypothetical protein
MTTDVKQTWTEFLATLTPAQKEELVWKVDERSQGRYTDSKLLSEQTLADYIASRPDQNEKIIGTSELVQPALGKFDDAYLAKLRAAFKVRDGGR